MHNAMCIQLKRLTFFSGGWPGEASRKIYEICRILIEFRYWTKPRAWAKRANSGLIKFRYSHSNQSNYMKLTGNKITTVIARGLEVSHLFWETTDCHSFVHRLWDCCKVSWGYFLGILFEITPKRPRYETRCKFNCRHGDAWIYSLSLH